MALLFVPYLMPFGQAIQLDVSADWRVIGFVLLLALAVTVLASLAPATGALKSFTLQALHEGGRSRSEGRGTSHVRSILVTTQFALSLALVAVSLLSARTVYNLRMLPTGFDVDHVALFGVDPEAALYDAARSQAYVESAVQRVAAMPGVRAAGFARIVPLGFGGSRTGVIVPGYQPGQDEDMGLNFNTVSIGYFEAMGIRLIRGRLFDRRDSRESTPVVVINETMARRYWTSGDALGRYIRFEERGPDVEVVGIVQDVKYRMLREDPAPSFYIPHAQSTVRTGVLHVRTWSDPGDSLTAIRQALIDVDRDVPLTTVRTLSDQATLNVSDERLAMTIAVTLAGAALLLAAVGLYGSMSYAIGQRMRELGVRVALGATVADIGRLILVQGMRLCVAGTLLGSALALAFGRAIEDRLFQISARDPLTLAAAAGILCLAGMLACWIPARRAMHVDPAIALRVD
jgi:predicted permease